MAAPSAHLKVLSGLLWPFFLAFTALGFVLVPFRIGDYHVGLLTSNVELQAALLWSIRLFDPIWLTLAVTCAYSYTIATEGLAKARGWALRIGLASLAVGIATSQTGFPLGPALYTDKMGARIAQTVPFTYPLLWITLILCSYYTARALIVRLPWFKQRVVPPWVVSLGAAVLVLLTDLNLEPVAWHNRFYWVWYPRDYGAPHWPPFQNYATWFAVAFALTLCGSSKACGAAPLKEALKPVAILGLFNAVLLLAHLLG
jgi:uncharacterized membrane protein